jgi:signal transduction histidine kinase/ActR/RegA family two-component response regulator
LTALPKVPPAGCDLARRRDPFVLAFDLEVRSWWPNWRRKRGWGEGSSAWLNVTQPEQSRDQALFGGAGPPPAELAQLAQNLGTARDLLDVFRALQVYTEAVTGNNALFVSLLDATLQLRRCVYAWSDGAEVDVSELPALPVSGSATPHARAVATGQVVVVTDLQAALADSPNVALGYERDPRPPNVSIAVPLAILGRVIGGFEVQIIEHANPSTCVPSLQVAANLAAAAIENLRLIETERELRRTAEASEQRYRGGEQRLRLALEAAGLGTWEYEVSSGALVWAAGTDRVLGKPGEQPPRSRTELLELAYAEDRPQLAKIFDAAIRTSGTREAEFRLEHATGERRWLACRIHTMVDSAGRPLRLFGVVLDITGRRDAEQQRQALARSNQLRVLGQMASGIAHDLNQSLALISGYGELARDALGSSMPDLAEVRSMLDMAVRAAQEGARTLQQLLAFSRTSEAEDLETVDLGALLREVARMTSPRWHSAAQEAHGIRLEVNISTDADLIVKASLPALREAFTNLIFNAVDALSEGGIIRLRGGLAGDRVVAEVSDNGPGIPQELQARIFEPFFTTKGERGTGLGLAQVSGVVARYGGELSVDSSPGRGTTFRILLPRAQALGVPRRDEIQDVHRTTGTRRVLAVDDEPKLRDMIARILEPHGHQVTLASSGEEALELMEGTGPFDLVLSDISMGSGMSGWDLAERIRERWPRTPVVLATGWGAQIDVEEARTRGVADVLAKPFGVSELRQLVAELTAGTSVENSITS